jgi:hypothetical protein
MSNPFPSSFTVLDTSSGSQRHVTMDVFSTILMISVNDRVCQAFPQRDLNLAHALRNTAAIPEQEHEFVHEGRNRSHFAWQGPLRSDVTVSVIMRYRHSKATMAIEMSLSMTGANSTGPSRHPWP